jgi:hypothetical protein
VGTQKTDLKLLSSRLSLAINGYRFTIVVALLLFMVNVWSLCTSIWAKMALCSLFMVMVIHSCPPLVTGFPVSLVTIAYNLIHRLVKYKRYSIVKGLFASPRAIP